MKKLTKEEVVRSVAKRWKAQYCKNGTWAHFKNDAKSTHKKLLTARDVGRVEELIGNDSWTSVVSASLCKPCLKKAKKLLKGD